MKSERGWLAAAPLVTLALFLLPIAAGLLGTALPAFGYLPALGRESFELSVWGAFFSHPATAGATQLSLVSGLLGTVLALAVTLLALAAGGRSRTFRAAQRLLAPLLAVPHVAIAVGVAFLIAPSGWLVRALEQITGGFPAPPGWLIAPDPWGLSLAFALAVKELPFLLLMTLGALPLVKADQRLAAARAMGYAPVTAWFKTVLPAVYPLIRLPIYAVLAFSLSVVDMSLVIGPSAPPTLAVLVLQWFRDPDLEMRLLGSAGALFQFALAAGVIALWRLGEILVAAIARRRLYLGRRGTRSRWLQAPALGVLWVLLLAGTLGTVLMALWSFARHWRYPELLPGQWSLAAWERHGGAIATAGVNSITIALAAALISLALVLACLENEERLGRSLTGRGLWLLYLPLLVPQIAFLFGAQVLAVGLRLDGLWPTLVWSHLLFALPYAFLALAESYRALDPRYIRTARSLGASPARVFWRVKLPLLLRPVLFAGAVAFAVSVAQYLPTLFIGAGRFATLTTEAVTSASGGDRRILGVYIFLQSALPLAAFALAVALPAWRARHRAGLRAGQ